VSCTTHAAADFLGLGLITVRELVNIDLEAGKSECGQKPGKPRKPKGAGTPGR
jgi:hypothetical protein